MIYLIILRIVCLARAQLVAEIDTVLGGKEPAFDNVDDLPFLHAVVNETLRYDSLVIVINDQTTPRLIRSMARARTRTQTVPSRAGELQGRSQRRRAPQRRLHSRGGTPHTHTRHRTRTHFNQN